MYNNKNKTMEWINIHLRFTTLRDGDIVVAKLEDVNFNKSNVAIGVYKNGSIYDSFILEDPEMDADWTILDDICTEFAVIGINIFDRKNNLN